MKGTGEFCPRCGRLLPCAYHPRAERRPERAEHRTRKPIRTRPPVVASGLLYRVASGAPWLGWFQ